MPLTMGAFTVSALSLIGVPFTAGFVSKVNLATAAADKGWWWAVAVIVITSVLAIIYMGRILLSAYFGDAPQIDGQAAKRNEAPMMMLVPMWILAIMSIAVGSNILSLGDNFVGAAEAAARLLLGSGA